jgi:hypothetical protein
MSGIVASRRQSRRRKIDANSPERSFTAPACTIDPSSSCKPAHCWEYSCNPNSGQNLSPDEWTETARERWHKRILERRRLRCPIHQRALDASEAFSSFDSVAHHADCLPVLVCTSWSNFSFRVLPFCLPSKMSSRCCPSRSLRAKRPE